MNAFADFRILLREVFSLLYQLQIFTFLVKIFTLDLLVQILAILDYLQPLSKERRIGHRLNDNFILRVCVKSNAYFPWKRSILSVTFVLLTGFQEPGPFGWNLNWIRIYFESNFLNQVSRERLWQVQLWCVSCLTISTPRVRKLFSDRSLQTFFLGFLRENSYLWHIQSKPKENL